MGPQRQKSSASFRVIVWQREDWEDVVPQAFVPDWPDSDVLGSWLYLAKGEPVQRDREKNVHITRIPNLIHLSPRTAPYLNLIPIRIIPIRQIQAPTLVRPL